MLRFNENNEIIRNDQYRAIVVGLQWKEDITSSMDELEALCQADGIEVVGRVEQNLDRPNTATLIGSGKVLELAELVSGMEVDTVVFNDELSGIQIRNLEDALGVRVIDRTILILDIFADRATSSEGKLQVELAQLQYRMTRLTGFGRSLSRLGGGIGTRGPGEKKLETDRRHIEKRIYDIKTELAKLAETRQTQKRSRTKSGMPVIALVGYTNSGKSAIMNRLIRTFEEQNEKAISPNSSDEATSKTVKSQDMLFATLDTAHRKISIGKGMDFILIDTVGFVSRLPHNLVEAFKSTLEEVKDADLLIHVVDSSNVSAAGSVCSSENDAATDRDFRIEVANKVIRQLGAGNTKTLMAYNKIDIAPNRPIDSSGKDTVYVSAETGEGIDILVEKIKAVVFADMVQGTLLIPYDRGNIASYLCDNARIDSMDYIENGTLLKGRFKNEDFGRYKQYEV
ncbi:MAG: GTPase HflX [Eubacteriales bacterium]|nr:GTPase HflX [Eubacteriales bacterium]